MDQRHRDNRTDERTSRSVVPDEAPDPVETRDPASRPTPRQSRSWLFALPAVALLILGGIWMFWAERARQGAQSAPYSVAGTSGATENDPEGSGRGDEKPLNPVGKGPSVIGDMELLTAKKEYVGRAVELRAIPVMSKPGPRTLWVGSPMNRPLVLLDRHVAPIENVPAGGPVAVSGTLQKRPDKDAIDRAGLDENDRKALEGADVFIRAKSVRPQQRTGPIDAPARQ